MKQLSLFNQPTLNVGKRIKEQLAFAAKNSRYSREELLDRINDLANRHGVRMVKGNGKGLTMATFEKWLNPEALEYIPPAQSLPTLCAVLEDLGAIREMLTPLGAVVLDEEEAKLFMWAKEYHRAKDARSKMRKLEMDL